MHSNVRCSSKVLTALLGLITLDTFLCLCRMVSKELMNTFDSDQHLDFSLKFCKVLIISAT